MQAVVVDLHREQLARLEVAVDHHPKGLAELRRVVVQRDRRAHAPLPKPEDHVAVQPACARGRGGAMGDTGRGTGLAARFVRWCSTVGRLEGWGWGGHARREAPGEEVVWIGGGGGGDRGGERSLWMRAIASARRRRSLAFTALIWTASTYSKTSDSLLASFSASSAASSSSGTAVCSARCPVETETRKVRGYRKTSPANEMITIRAMKKPRAVSSIAAAEAMRRRAPAAQTPRPAGLCGGCNSSGRQPRKSSLKS